MKLKILAFVTGTVALAILSGCGSLLTKTAAPNSVAVQSGIATTNDLASVAVIKEVEAANAALNPTPSQPLINAALVSLGTLLTVASGWYLRHKTTISSPTPPTTTITPPKT